MKLNRIFALVLSLMLLTACGSASKVENKTTDVSIDTPVISSSEEISNEEDIEETEKKHVDVWYGDEGYDSMFYLSPDCVAIVKKSEDVTEDGKAIYKFGAAEYDGKEIVAPEYDTWSAGHEDKGFAFSKREEDGSYKSTFYDSKGNVRWGMNWEDANAYFYSKEVVQYSTASKNGFLLFVKTGDTDFDLKKIDESVVPNMIGYSEYQNGKVIVDSRNYGANGKFINYVDKDGKAGSFDFPEGSEYTCMITRPIAASPEGYIIGYALGSEIDINKVKMIAYNINTNDYVDFPEGTTQYVSSRPGLGLQTGVFGHYAAIAKDDGLKAVFDIDKKELLTEYKYYSFDPMYYGIAPYIVAQNNDASKYIYLDDETFEELAEYDYATNFSGDYAVIKQDDNLYIINQSFEIVSDIIDADNCKALVNGYFVAEKDDKSYIMTVTE